MPDVEVNPEMPRNRSKAVPEGKSPFPHHDEFGSGEPTMTELYRMLEERFDRSDKQLHELIGKMRATNPRLADLQHHAQQPRLATEADSYQTRRLSSVRRTLQQIERSTASCFGDDPTEPPALQG